MLFLVLSTFVPIRATTWIPTWCWLSLLHQALQDYFDNTWILTESLFAGLQGEEAFMRRPLHGLRHPLIFYYGHVAALYVNKLRAARLVKVGVYFLYPAAGIVGEEQLMSYVNRRFDLPRLPVVVCSGQP